MSCRELGLHQTWLIIKYRAQRGYFIHRMRKKIVLGKADHTWHQLARSYKKEWHVFFDGLCKQQLSYVQQLFAKTDAHRLMSDVDSYAHHMFQALGSSWYMLDDQMWHTDIRLKQQGASDTTFSATVFYADIVIESGQGNQIGKDIKVPWELSRLQHLLLLGYMYQITDNMVYKDAFVVHVQHWHKHNPYLLGINWLCPMEVGLRSISLVIAFHLFKHTDIDASFWQSYTALLYDHMVYLEHNWEWYDGRTSNHYLSDLVGYLYLCFFFQAFHDVSRKRDWVIKEILNEMEKQVFKEGTSYEGSTRYHVLVTELFYHVEKLSEVMQISLPQSFHEQLLRMFEFINWCSIDREHMITIGDHDGGRVTWAGLPYEIICGDKQSTYIKHYNQFGISIIKDDCWHLSLRHHAYDVKQPSGHYHNDVGSITLAIKGIPVLVDPGSYLYTASIVERNRFRSASVHNMVHIAGQEPILFDDRLFALAIPINQIPLSDHNKKILQTSHRLYDKYRLIYNRSINVGDNAIEIYDIFNSIDNVNVDINIFYNFTFASSITLHKEGDVWLGYHQKKPLFVFETPFEVEQQVGYYSPTYGVKIETVRLGAIAPLEISKYYRFRFVNLNSE